MKYDDEIRSEHDTCAQKYKNKSSSLRDKIASMVSHTNLLQRRCVVVSQNSSIITTVYKMIAKVFLAI